LKIVIVIVRLVIVKTIMVMGDFES